MLLERSEILIQAGREDDFAAAMDARGVPLLASVPGVQSVQFGRGLENPDKFIILVVWKDMDAHIAFTTTPAFTDLKQLMMPHSKGGAMEHFNMR